MRMPDWIAVLGIVLFMTSTLLWGIPWNRFTEESRKTKRVEPVAFKRTAVTVGAGALLSGFLLGLLGFLASLELYIQARTPGMLLLGLVVFPLGFAALIASMFLLKAATLRALYETDGQSHPRRKQNGGSE
jgi:hypothetical protein